MDNALKIPKDHPHHGQLQEVINSLLVIAPTEAVYVSQIGDDKDAPSFITVILMDNCGQNSEGFQSLSEKIQLDYPYFIFKFLEDAEASNKFDEGNMYCIRHCNVSHLVYYVEGHTMFYPVSPKPKKIFWQSRKHFNERRNAHFETFGKAASHFRDNNTVEAAAYLYRSLLTMYCFYLEVLSGDTMDEADYVDFNEAYFRITKAFPSLKIQLNLDIQQDREMIDTLNSAHICSLKKETMMPVDNLILERAIQKFNVLEETLAALYYEYLKYCKALIKDVRQQSSINTSILTEKVSPNYFVKDALAEISEVITGFLKTRAIFCFGYTTKWADLENRKKNHTDQPPGHHFYLLVFTSEHKPDAIFPLLSLIKDRLEAKHTATLLLHRVRNLSKQKHNQKYFFNSVMANGLTVYQDPAHPIYPLKIDMARDITFTRKYWKNRMLAAESFLDIVCSAYDNPQAVIRNALLQQAVQQVVVALLDLFLGYHPNNYSTKYLLSLVECIPGVQPLFDDSDQDRKLLWLLSAHIDMIKHKELETENSEESNPLYSKCVDFFDAATRLGQQELERLENLNNDDDV